MHVLYKLFFTRIKAGIRNVFSRVSSAVFAIAMIVLYGGLIALSLMYPEVALSMQHIDDANASIMIGIGFTALMVAVMLLQKKKVLFMEEDAFYLFSGPFTRKQIMRFLLLQNMASAWMCGAISLLMVIFLGNKVAFTFPFLLLAFLCFSLVYTVFLIVYYYVYLLSIQKESCRFLPQIAAVVYGLMIACVYAIVLIQNKGDVSGSVSLFLNTELFYWIPLFGWIKMILVSYIAHHWGMLFFGIGLLLLTCLLFYHLLCAYKGEFIERAMQDAQEYTALYKDMRAGKRDSMNERKIHAAQVKFQTGAMAIFSKNILLMRKTNDFIRWTDVMVLGMYLVITLLMDMGFGFYMYMMMFWLFSVVQNTDFMKDMNNYQIYLIPDKPLKKLLCVLLPTFLKLVVPMVLALVIAACLFHEETGNVISYFVMQLGYAMLFLSASVLSLRILKSRNNAFMENMLRMLIVLAAAIPGIATTIYFLMHGELTFALLQKMTILSLAMNIVISLVIIILCAPMMNGREIKSE